MDKSIIIDFLRAGFNITPGALSFIKNQPDPTKYVRIFLNSLNCRNRQTTITKEMLETVDQALSGVKQATGTMKKTAIVGAKVLDKACESQVEQPPPVQVDVSYTKPGGQPAAGGSPSTGIPATRATIDPATALVPATGTISFDGNVEPRATETPGILKAYRTTSKSTFVPRAKEHDPEVKVIEDCTNHLKNDGEFSDFLAVFSDRFDKLKAMFKNRPDLGKLVDIQDVAHYSRNDREMSIAGMVVDKRLSKAGNVMLTIDDKTSTVNLVISGRDVDKKLLDNIVLDEVMCFKGFSKDGKLFIATEFFWPDIRPHKPVPAEEDISILLLSDMHVGSDNHLGDLWDRLRAWLNGEGISDKAKELAGKVKYVSIAGDLVDGVGVYPTQEQHLVIKDVHAQFARVTEMLQDLPDHVTFIISPGSHEPVRRALPQPAIPELYAKGLYDLGAVMVGDPAIVETHGVKTLLYHGESFIDLSIDIPAISNKNPEDSMQKLLVSRHLAPTFGKKTELAPDKRDWLVINEVPDIFHSGHVHCNGVKMYKGTWMINSGCFQGQTDFMKGLGIVPTPGKPNIVNLKTFELTTLNLGA